MHDQGRKMVKPKMSNWDWGTTTSEQQSIVMAGSIRPWREQRRSSGLAAPSPCLSYSSSASTHQAWRPHQPGSLMAMTCARSRIMACGAWCRWPAPDSAGPRTAAPTAAPQAPGREGSVGRRVRRRGWSRRRGGREGRDRGRGEHGREGRGYFPP